MLSCLTEVARVFLQVGARLVVNTKKRSRKLFCRQILESILERIFQFYKILLESESLEINKVMINFGPIISPYLVLGVK